MNVFGISLDKLVTCVTSVMYKDENFIIETFDTVFLANSHLHHRHGWGALLFSDECWFQFKQVFDEARSVVDLQGTQFVDSKHFVELFANLMIFNATYQDSVLFENDFTN